MWTPRRLLLVVTGLVLFTGGFTLYASVFGWIDGLPPLPEGYTRELVDGGEVPEITRGLSPILARLRTAFGADCVEQTYLLKLENREKGLLFAAAEQTFLPDGRVQLNQVSVAVFGKGNHELSTIHSDRAFLTFDQPVRKIDDMGSRKVVAAELHADPEYATNDPRKGKVIITNNRKTPEPDDDVILRTPGPLFYVDDPKPGQPHIWTFQAIELTDRQNRPLPSQAESRLELPTVTSIGMRIYLMPAATAPAPAAGPAKKEHKSPSAVGGVDHIELDRQVLMNLWTESGNMLGSDSGKPPAPREGAEAPREKVLVTIQTDGPFAYDNIKDIAHFEVPPKADPGLQEYVKVTRHAKGNQEDTLTSDFLDVQFARKRQVPAAGLPAVPLIAPPPAAPPTADAPVPENNMEIETVHAWGKNIALSSDQDSLFAYGSDLFYDARIKQTVLKGSPMHAVKNGNLIRAPELLMAHLEDSEKQNARARGPGVVGMGDIDPKTQEHSRQAFFQESLVVAKVQEQGKNLDLITLTGKARFMDTINDQRISARQLKLWMIGREPQPGAAKPDAKGPAAKTAPKPKIEAKMAATVAKAPPEPKPKIDNKAPAKKSEPEKKGKEEGKQLPHRMEAAGEVSVHSPDLVVLRSEYLNVWFKDVPPPPKPVVPEASPPPSIAPPPPAPKKDEPSEKKGPPLIVRHSRRIEAWVNRVDGVNDIDKIHNEGNVIIHQDPTPENETGVDIAGHTVDMEHFVQGNYLIVEGNDQNLGEVHFDKISIIADDIKIDQRDNTANVKGPGSMRLLSKTSLDGTELKTPTFIDVFWNEAMELDGPIRSVRYEGSVQAKQNDSKVLCETMQVWLDRPLFLNQTSKPKPKTPIANGANVLRGGQIVSQPTQGKPSPAKKADNEDDSPKVEKVLCDQLPANPAGKKQKQLQLVSAEDSEKLAGKIIKYQHVLGTHLEMDNLQNKMTSYGPGSVRIFQAGSKDPMADQHTPESPKGKQKPREKPAIKDTAEEEMKLTWVSFDRRMIAFNNDPKRAVFYSNVELVHMASDRPDVAIDITHLPEKALYLKCNEKLEIMTLTRKSRDASGKEIEVKWQEMKATGNVHVRNEDFDGYAGVVTYSEEKTLLVFYGTPGNLAKMDKWEIKGGNPRTTRAEKITYNVKTKDFSFDGSMGGSN